MMQDAIHIWGLKGFQYIPLKPQPIKDLKTPFRSSTSALPLHQPPRNTPCYRFFRCSGATTPHGPCYDTPPRVNAQRIAGSPRQGHAPLPKAYSGLHRLNRGIPGRCSTVPPTALIQSGLMKDQEVMNWWGVTLPNRLLTP
jgi:hypothetical protein